MTDRRLLDRLAADAWPALEQVERDGWVLRASYGVTKRANSALPRDVDLAALDDVLPRITSFYAERELPALAMVGDPALDAELDARGWRREAETVVLAGPTPRGGAGVDVDDAPTTAWLDCWWAVDGRGGDAELDVARRILAAVEAPVGYARVQVDGEVVAVGRGVTQEGWLGVFGMAVLPHARRRGLATAVLRALGDWAAQHGACSTYLQVHSANDAALRLYDSVGLAPASRYAYRSPG